MIHGRLLIIGELSFMSLVYAFFYRIMGYRSIFLKVNHTLRNEKFINRLSDLDISMVDYSCFRYFDFSKNVSLRAQLAKKVYAKIFYNNELTKYESGFQETEDIDKKLKIVIIDRLIGLLGELSDVLICAEYYQNEFDVVSIYTKSNGFVKIALSGEEYQRLRNVSSAAYFYFSLIIALLQRVASIAIKKILHFLKQTKIQGEQKQFGSQEKNWTEYEILYFPHQGVACGDLFLKDHYYMDDPCSPFYRNRIFHIEYQRLADEEINKNIVSFYEKNNIPHCYIPGFKFWSLKNRSLCNLKYLLRGNVFRENCFVLKKVLVVSIYKQYETYLHFLSRFQNAKIALIGYDVLFPRVLSMALSAKRITSIATQERLMQSHYDHLSHIMVDYYFPISKTFTDRLSSNGLSYVKRVIPLGPIRADLINAYRCFCEDKCVSIKKERKLVIAYDFPAQKDFFDASSDPILNWKNNSDFYNDLIRLSKDLPDIYIIIRGRNDDWCSLPAFSALFEKIMNAPNIEIDRDYGALNISYMLASFADLIIAKHTSIGDEALACGIPVLFHDYFLNMKRAVSSVFNYNNYPVFVYSYSDLKSRVQGIINGADPLSSELLKEMKRDLFTIPKNGTVREKLHSELTNIYLNGAKELYG